MTALACVDPLPFDPASVAGLDEPVRRYFLHALSPGAAVSAGVRLQMKGRIKVGPWLPFQAEWKGDGRSFVWRARVGLGRLTLLGVVDRHKDGRGSSEVRLLGRVAVAYADDEDTVRSGAGRAAIEGAIWAPGGLLPERGVSWRAKADDLIAATWDVAPERPEVQLRIDGHGAVLSASTMRWDNGDHGLHGYIPCGGEVLAERRFGDLVIPSRVSVGWWFGTPRFSSFFEVEVLRAEPLD